MRIAALQCNYEGGEAATLRVPGLWQEFGFNAEQLFHTHSDLYTGVFDRERHGALLTRYLAEARGRGLAVILYMNGHILLPSQDDKLEAWGQKTRDGAYDTCYGSYYVPCLHSPWVAHFEAALESLAEYDIDGVFLDGPSSGLCYCARCDGCFRDSAGISLKDAPPDQVAQFALRTRIEFIKRFYCKTKAVNARWISYVNLHLLHSGASARETAELLACNDWIGTEGGFQFYGRPADTNLWRCGMHAKLVEAVAGPKPRVIFMAGDHKPWSWYLHTPSETRLCYASILANGAGAWYGIHSSTESLASASGRAVRAMVQFDAQHADLYEHTESMADVALFYSFDTARHAPPPGEQTDFYTRGPGGAGELAGSYADAVQGAYAAIFRSGLPFDVVTELNTDALSRYRVLVIPAGACTGSGTCAALRAFVAAGGTIVADGETSLFDEDFRKQPDFLLAELFGVSFRGYRAYQPHDYFAMSPGETPFAADGVRHIPAPLVALDVAVAAGAEVQARLYPPLAGRYAGRPETPEHPFIVRNRVGKGTVYYIAGTFFELYNRYAITHCQGLLRHLILRHAAPPAEVPGAPRSLELSVRKSMSGNCTLVHLVNYAGGMTRPVDRVIPLHGLSLRMRRPYGESRALVDGRVLTADRDGRLALPPIAEFEVIVLR